MSKLFTLQEQLILAVSEDDVDALQNLNITVDDLLKFEFESGMNILNFSIDKENENILHYLCDLLKNRPSDRRNLVQHFYGKNKI